MKSKVFLWTIISIIMISSALGIGITPAKTSVPSSGEYGFYVVNNDKINFQVNVYAEGELARYITFKETSLSFSPEEEKKKVSFKIDLPERAHVSADGLNIVIEEVPAPGSQFSAKMVLKHKVIITSSETSADPGSAELKISESTSEGQGTVNFIIPENPPAETERQEDLTSEKTEEKKESFQTEYILLGIFFLAAMALSTLFWIKKNDRDIFINKKGLTLKKFRGSK